MRLLSRAALHAQEHNSLHSFEQATKRIRASVVLASLISFVAAGIPAARSQPAGQSATIVMRLVDTILSATDPPGKQYRAVVTQTTTAGSLSIPLSTEGTIALAQSGGEWSAQLTSLLLNGRAVPVTSSSVSATSPLQQAQQAVQKLGGLLGGFGNRVAAPVNAAVATAIASGPKVVLPAGTVLTFTASVQQPAAQPSVASNGAPAAAPVATGAHPATASAASHGNVAAPAAGGGAAGICERAVASPGAQPKYYVSAIFGVPGNNRMDWQAAWNYYIQGVDPSPYTNGGGCTFFPTHAGAQQYMEMRKKNLGSAKLVETGWVYTGPVQPPPPAAPNPGNGK